MSNLKRMASLVLEARKLELSLLRIYFEVTQEGASPSTDYGIGYLVKQAQEPMDRRREAYITECLRVEPADPPVEAQLDTTELNAQWPSLENMPDGVDILREKYGPPTGEEARHEQLRANTG